MLHPIACSCHCYCRLVSCIFEKAFETHEHFSAEKLYEWLRQEDGPKVSRATVYRTLDMLERGGFIESLDVGRGELVYEHVLGHKHHDHLVCTECGRIEEFREHVDTRYAAAFFSDPEEREA